jgi:predicted ABC-type ATPase
MSAARPVAFALAGPNGAGKTTSSARLLRERRQILEYVNADLIAQGLSSFNAEAKAFEAGRIMLAELHRLGAARASFAFETTLASRSFAPWISELRTEGYEFQLAFLWLPSAELAVERVRHRVASGGHSVPEETIRRRYARGIRNFHEIYRPIADSWTVYDNSVGMPRAIARGVGGGERVYFEAEWQQFCEIES